MVAWVAANKMGFWLMTHIKYSKNLSMISLERAHTPHRRKTAWSLLLPAMLVLLLSVSACSDNTSGLLVYDNPQAVSDETADTEDANSGDETIGGASQFQLLALPSKEGQTIYTSMDGDQETPCIAEAGDDVDCVVDVHELDLMFHGITLQNSVPGDMCDYRSLRPFYYALAPVDPRGVPRTVRYTADDEGNLVDCEFEDDYGEIYNECRVNFITYSAGESEYIPETVDEIACRYDYSNENSTYINGKNCCAGAYTEIATNSKTGEVTTTTKDWGGNYGDCLEGPGVDAIGGDLEGIEYPGPVYTSIDGVGALDEYTIEGLEGETDLRGNTFAANYFDEEDHEYGLPGPIYFGQEDYIYDCLDSNYEVIARIRLKVREWNLKSELENGGDPDTTGIVNGEFKDYADDIYDFSALEAQDVFFWGWLFDDDEE